MNDDVVIWFFNKVRWFKSSVENGAILGLNCKFISQKKL